VDKPKFVYVTYIATTPEKLWQALTDGDINAKYWSGYRMKSEWKVGAKVEILMPDGRVGDTGIVLECDRPRRLSFSWHVEHHEEMRKEPESRATFVLVPVGKVVKLTLIHDQFEAGSLVYQGIQDGWPMILSSLKSLLETGAPLPFAT